MVISFLNQILMGLKIFQLKLKLLELKMNFLLSLSSPFLALVLKTCELLQGRNWIEKIDLERAWDSSEVP